MTLCPLRRTLASLWFDNPDRLPGFIRSHVRHCPACRAHLERESGLVRALQTAGADRRESLPPFLSARIRSGCCRAGAGREVAPKRVVFGGALAWTGVAVVAVLLAGMVLLRWPGPTPAAVIAQPRPLPWSGTLAWPAGLAWSPWEQPWEQPLNREIASALEDSRSALIALVENFVPESSVAVVCERANGLFPEWSAPATAEP